MIKQFDQLTSNGIPCAYVSAETYAHGMSRDLLFKK